MKPVRHAVRTGVIRQAAIVVVLAATATACHSVTFHPAPQCGQAPRLEGRWTGMLGEEMLELNLNETCGWVDFLTPGWVVDGGWTWGVVSGGVFSQPWYLTDRLVVSLYPNDGTGVPVRLEFPRNLTPADMLVGFARGSWRNPADTSKTLVSFDSVALTLRRN